MRITLLTVLVVTLLACEQGSGDNRGNFVAYSWEGEGQQFANIRPFYWLKNENYETLDQFVADAKAATDSMPDGQRVLFSWNLHRSMAYQMNGDFLYDPQGQIAGCNSASGFKPYRSLWWDNGVEVVRERFEKFFQAYARAGGKLDVFVLDFEQGFSYWHLYGLAEENYASCGLDAYLDAIQNDERFQRWREQLGFDDLKSMQQWYKNDHDEKWGALVWHHLAAYIDQAIYQPMKKYFPDADFSNYGYYYQRTDYNFPDIHGHYRHKFTHGIHVGTHQSRELYGWVDLPIQTRLNEQPYPTTPYNAFRFAINKLRAMVLSSDVPVSPWVAYKGFSGGALADNDYYQELIFHILLSGVDYLLYWNPGQHTDFEANNDRLLDDLLQQVNTVIDDTPIALQTRELANWLDDVLITKIELADRRALWRITANLDADKNIMDSVVSHKPLQLQINDLVYNFPGMKILHTDPSLSTKGLWLTPIEPN